MNEQLTPIETVDAMRKIGYEGYSTAIHSMANNPERYGISITPIASARLKAAMMPPHNSTVDVADAIKMYEAGSTYREVADKYGVSKQYIHQLLAPSNIRKNNTDLERIKFKGFYDYFKRTDTSYAAFARYCGLGSRASHNAFQQLMKNEKCDARFTVGQMLAMCKETNCTLTELFELRK